MPTNSKLGKIRNIVHKHITEVRGEVCPKGWLGEMVMDGLSFHPNKAQISLGKKLAPMFKEILRMNYTVPEFIAGREVTKREAQRAYLQLKRKTSDIPIFTHYDISELNGFMATEVMRFNEKQDQNKSLRFDNNYIAELVIRARKEIPRLAEVGHVFVDLCFIQGNKYVAIELKSTGDEDNTGADTTLMKRIVIPLTIMPNGSRCVFGIMTNNKGRKKNGEWKGQLGSKLSGNNILIEDELWDLIAPNNVRFDDFKSVFNSRFREFRNKFTKVYRSPKN